MTQIHFHRKNPKQVRFRILVAIGLLGVLVVTGLLYGWSRNLPDVRQLDGLHTLVAQPPSGSANLPEPIPGEYTDPPVALSEVAPIAVTAIVASEDRRFYQHRGFDLIGLARSLWSTLVLHRREGGSTITAQLVRSTILPPDNTLQRKFKELWLSFQVEQRYSKQEILAGYLNTVYWGKQLRGIHAAAKAYFRKSPRQLDLAEGVYLASLLPAPNLRQEDPALMRREVELRLGHMVQAGQITKKQAQQALIESATTLGGENASHRN